MSSSDGNRDIAVTPSGAPGNARARRAATAALATALATPLACAGAVGAEPPAAQPTPFETPLYWGDLPPPTALVHIKTPIGDFTLPMGYLGNWFSLRKQPVTTALDGARQFTGALPFQFEYPSGGMNGNPAWMLAVHDDKGHEVPGRTVVYVNEIKPPNRWNRDQYIEAETLGTYPTGSLVHDDAYSRPEHKALMGASAGSGPGHRIGVELSCEVNCLFSFYLEHRRLVLEGVIDGRFRHDGLAIAEQAQALFEHWQTTPACKGD